MPTATAPSLSAAEYQREVSSLAAAASAEAAASLEAPSPQLIPTLARILYAYQLAAAYETVVRTAAPDQRWQVDPEAFAGRTALGFPNEAAIAGMLRAAPSPEWVSGVISSEVLDAARGAAAAQIVALDSQSYVRVLQLPSCSRCVIIAGRVYKALDGFRRHPLCDCLHWPVESKEAALADGLVADPMEAFEKGLITGLSKADEAAIRDGADIGKVVNAAQGMSTASVFGKGPLKTTLSGTTKRSAWRKANPDRPVRLRPASIYDLATDQEDAIRLLRLYGYIG